MAKHGVNCILDTLLGIMTAWTLQKTAKSPKGDDAKPPV
jgi:hypothetical protein